MAWMNGQGVFHGTLNLAVTAADIVESTSLLPYPYSAATSHSPPSSPKAPAQPIPISMAVTEFHFLFLFHDRVCAVSRLDDKLVWEDLLGLRPTEKPIAITADPVEKTYWIYTNSSLLEVQISQEDRDVWRIQLKRENHEVALQFARTPAQRAFINASLADHHFKTGQFIQAAQCYAQSTRGFEDVALAFHDAGEPDALRYFLVCRLERVPKTALTQRMMLATWLVEIYLGKLNTLDDVVASESASMDVENLRAERTVVDDELRQFLQTYKANLHKPTTYDLILSHGRTDVLLYYASVVGDHKRIVEHYVMNEEWGKAVDQLSRQSDLDLYYNFSSVLMRHNPKETVDSWLRQPSLDPLRLIPALLQNQHAPVSPIQPNHAVRYLQHVVFAAGSTSPMVHNLLITFLATPSPIAKSASPASSHSKLPTSTPISDPSNPPLNAADLPLLRFLSTAPKDPLTSRPYYDLDYALRLCKRNNRFQACVHIYAQMEMWEESVELALEMGELELAKVNADRPEDDEVLRKKLWLMVAKYVVQDKKDIKTAMRFLDNTTALKIEDILPFFPDFVIIDDFKDEICTALEGYSAQIEALKTEMNDATRTADNIKQDIENLKHRFVTVEPAESCASCNLPLLTREFYIFPCQHSFHANCLIGQVKEYLYPTSLRRIIHLQDELMRLTNTAPQKGSESRQNSVIVANGQQPLGAQQARNLLSAGANIGRAVVAPAITGGKVMVAAGAGLRDLIIPESLATAITSNINLNINIVPGWGAGGEEKAIKSTQRARERAEKLKNELDELLAAECPLCQSVVVGLDKPFVLSGEVDHSWDL
ncbi:hypothetical protein DL93DRAFT_2073232 [Clavulina sp. PMI_390]|nr:hypothetical protein DL93DRAFT_2073232 [Clavulina sp. PMI_390]